MPLYDHDFQPVTPSQRGAFNGHRWQPPFDLQTSAWQIDRHDPTKLVLDCPTDHVNVLTYGGNSANDFGVVYAYNDVRSYHNKPKCSDLMVRFYVRPSGEGSHCAAN